MTTQSLTEATLMAPVFNGSDEEVAQCTSAWSSIISSFTYACGSVASYGALPMSPENKRAMYVALQCYLNTKVDELNNVTVPPVVSPSTVGLVPVFAPAPAPNEMPEVDFTSQQYEGTKPVTESLKKVNPMLKRMRELAGLPHPENHV